MIQKDIVNLPLFDILRISPPTTTGVLPLLDISLKTNLIKHKFFSFSLFSRRLNEKKTNFREIFLKVPNIGDYNNESGEDKMPLVTICVEK